MMITIVNYHVYIFNLCYKIKILNRHGRKNLHTFYIIFQTFFYKSYALREIEEPLMLYPMY